MKKDEPQYGVFCETYGATAYNRVLESLLINRWGDFAIGDIVEETGLSKPKVYELAKEFEKKGFLLKTRVVGKTQLYKVNKEEPRMKLFIRDFNECLKLVVQQYSTKNKNKDSGSSKASVASTKSF